MRRRKKVETKKKKNFPFSLVNIPWQQLAVFNKILFYIPPIAHNPHEKVGDRGGCLIGLPLGLSLSFPPFHYTPRFLYIISPHGIGVVSWSFAVGRTRVFTLETRWSDQPLSRWYSMKWGYYSNRLIFFFLSLNGYITKEYIFIHVPRQCINITRRVEWSAMFGITHTHSWWVDNMNGEYRIQLACCWRNTTKHMLL